MSYTISEGPDKNLEGCLWKQRTHKIMQIGDMGFYCFSGVQRNQNVLNGI